MAKAEEDRISNVVIYIHSNLHESRLSLQTLALRFAYSPSSLKRQFKLYLGVSVGHYILETRMEKARGLLLDGRHTVAEIGCLIGYSNLSHFSRVFTKYHGYQPSKIS